MLALTVAALTCAAQLVLAGGGCRAGRSETQLLIYRWCSTFIQSVSNCRANMSFKDIITVFQNFAKVSLLNLKWFLFFLFFVII